jgi:hypothetical protein
MTTQTREELKQYFKEFEESLPDTYVMKKAGPYGEDVEMKKERVNGVYVYRAPVKIPSIKDLELRTA